MCMCCVSHSGHPIVLSQASQLLQIQTPQAASGSMVAMPMLKDKSAPVAAPPLVSVALRTPSSDDDVSQSTLNY